MARTPSTMRLSPGDEAPAFDLANHNVGVGRERVTRESASGEHGLLVMFICNHCPFVKHIADELARLGHYASSHGIGVVAIQPNDVANFPDDAPSKMTEEAESRGYTFPYAYDEDQSVAKAYAAACTPDFYLFDADRRLYYRGQLDDSRPGSDVPVTGADLRAAIGSLLAGDPPPEVQKPSLGCNIKWIAGNEPDYFGS
ncbi:MAG: thioredoxin family protein [Phycisphaerales bacterium]